MSHERTSNDIEAPTIPYVFLREANTKFLNNAGVSRSFVAVSVVLDRKIPEIRREKPQVIENERLKDAVGGRELGKTRRMSIMIMKKKKKWNFGP